MLEREDVGHLYYLFTWAQRLLKVASFQEIFIKLPPFHHHITTYHHFIQLQLEDQILLLQSSWNELIIAGLAHRKVGAKNI